MAFQRFGRPSKAATTSSLFDRDVSRSHSAREPVQRFACHLSACLIGQIRVIEAAAIGCRNFLLGRTSRAHRLDKFIETLVNVLGDATLLNILDESSGNINSVEGFEVSGRGDVQSTHRAFPSFTSAHSAISTATLFQLHLQSQILHTSSHLDFNQT